MLGAAISNYSQLKFPLLASPKLDGVRAIRFGPEFYSRTLKTIPNRAVAEAFRHLSETINGFDGELICGDPTATDVYRRTNSKLMRINGDADDVRFFVFDYISRPDLGFADRNAGLDDYFPLVVKLDQRIISDAADLHEYESQVLKQGYEGVILRDPQRKYKYGRSTVREQGMLKVKNFTDAEATVIGFEELMHNANPAMLDERGYTKRSTHLEHKVPMDCLGALICEVDGAKFRIGTGFTQAERHEIWRHQDQYRGQNAKFKYFSTGMKDLPRHPVFLGWRDPIDTEAK